MKTASPTPQQRDRQGFTLVELLTVLTLAALLVVALQQALITQRHFYETQGAVSHRNETVRIAMAVLGGALREGSIANGDLTLLGPRRVRLRMPLGSAVVCGTDPAGVRVGLVNVRGRWQAGVADSVTIRRGAAATSLLLTQVAAPAPQVPCLAASPGLTLRLEQNVPDVDVPSPARAFRSQILEAVPGVDGQYLHRVDGAQREVLVGPLDPTDGFSAWYTDLTGAVVTDPAQAHRLAVRVIAKSPDIRGEASNLRDTIYMSFGGRN